MRNRIHPAACLVLALCLAAPALSQVTPEATGGSDDQSQMMTPPPVSGQAYPSEVGGAVRANYLRAGLAFTAGYIDNYYLSGTKTVGETTYSILPTIAYDQTTPRQHRVFTYSPGFTFYNPSSALNETDQSLNASYQYRLTEHVNIGASDSFQDSSTLFSSPSSIDGISGEPPSTAPGILAPFAQRLTNTAKGQLSYQFSRMGMLGVSGNSTILSYPNPGQSTGLYDSDEFGGGGFFNRRLNGIQYMGVNYAYSQGSSHLQGADSQTQTHTIFVFYTITPKHELSLSISGGPQHHSIEQSGLPASGSWGPSVTGSMGWQGTRTNLAASYSHQVTSGGGLLGVFKSSSASASARWQITRVWSAGANANYAINKSITPVAYASTQGGHTVSGSARVERQINTQFNIDFEFDRLHQSYNGITSVASNPNMDRATVTVNWQFSRPLGR